MFRLLAAAIVKFWPQTNDTALPTNSIPIQYNLRTLRTEPHRFYKWNCK